MDMRDASDIRARERARIEQILDIGSRLGCSVAARGIALGTDISVAIADGVLRTCAHDADLLRSKVQSENEPHLRLVGEAS